MAELKTMFLAGSLIKPVRGFVNLIARQFFPRLYAHLLDGVQPLTTI